jgi:hypothetical protein
MRGPVGWLGVLAVDMVSWCGLVYSLGHPLLQICIWYKRTISRPEYDINMITYAADLFVRLIHLLIDLRPALAGRLVRWLLSFNATCQSFALPLSNGKNINSWSTDKRQFWDLFVQGTDSGTAPLDDEDSTKMT